VPANITYIVQFNDDNCKEIILVPTHSAHASLGTTLVYWRSTWSLSVLNMGSKTVLRQMMKFVNWRNTCSLLVVNIASKHETRQLKKSVYWFTICSLFVLNMASKQDTRHLK